MADIKHPEGEYTVEQVGPSRPYSFDDKNNPGQKVDMVGYSIKFKDIPDWVDLSVLASAEAPTEGIVLEGHIEDAGQYGLKFKKKRKGGFFGGGGGKGSSIGAQWSAAYDVASRVVAGYFAASGTKPKSIKDYVSKVDEVAPTIKGLVDARVKSDKPAETKDDTNSEAGESKPEPSAGAKKDVVIEDVDENELGDW